MTRVSTTNFGYSLLWSLFTVCDLPVAIYLDCLLDALAHAELASLCGIHYAAPVCRPGSGVDLWLDPHIQPDWLVGHSGYC